MIERSSRHWRVLLTYIFIGVVLYWAALRAFFVSDDFEFLTIVVSAKSWLVIFEPLVGRYVRPLVVLMYYACYKLFGLSPVPYHIAGLLLHVFNASCVYLIALRLLPGRNRVGAFLTGLLFLVFSSHSEAVAWPAGVADPVVAALLLPAFLAYLRALEPGAPARWLWIAFALMLCGLLAKETWVVFPPIVLVHAVLLAEAGQARRRAATLIVASGIAVAAYLLVRRVVFGGVTTGYGGLGTSLGTGIFFGQARAFFLRSVVPGGLRALDIWQRHRDLIIWPLVALVVIVRGQRPVRRVVLFAACAAVIALAPTLPFTISIVTTESERFTYLPTAFSCLFIVGAATAVLRRPALVAGALAPLILWHGVVLTRDTHRLRDAGEMARGIVDSFAAAVRRYDPEDRRPIFLLNLPDNLNGAYVFRRGFYPAVQLFAPDVAQRTERTIGVATNAIGSVYDRATVRRVAPDRFALELGTGAIVQPQIPSSVWYRIVEQRPTSYEVEFAPTNASAVVLFTSGSRVDHAGDIASRGMPFGTLEIPADGSACQGDATRFSGWALDTRAVARVVVDAVGDDGTARPIGDAPFAPPGSRPDVAAIYSWLPNSRRAEWNYLLPCALVAAAPKGELRVRVTAIDSEGQRTDLGTRLIKAGR